MRDTLDFLRCIQCTSMGGSLYNPPYTREQKFRGDRFEERSVVVQPDGSCFIDNNGAYCKVDDKSLDSMWNIKQDDVKQYQFKKMSILEEIGIPPAYYITRCNNHCRVLHCDIMRKYMNDEIIANGVLPAHMPGTLSAYREDGAVYRELAREMSERIESMAKSLTL